MAPQLGVPQKYSNAYIFNYIPSISTDSKITPIRLCVVNIHLKSCAVGNLDLKPELGNILKEIAKRHPNFTTPVLLCGDFNYNKPDKKEIVDKLVNEIVNSTAVDKSKNPPDKLANDGVNVSSD